MCDSQMEVPEEEQGESGKGKGCVDQIFVTKTVVEEYIERKVDDYKHPPWS